MKRMMSEREIEIANQIDKLTEDLHHMQLSPEDYEAEIKRLREEINKLEEEAKTA